ncbi:MAG: hypothetical protein D6744_05015 [Planctomycetota bacterium]|nr:MAG: hypothetical protein D6744_05015 [Planctomycetota bacterium]
MAMSLGCNTLLTSTTNTNEGTSTTSTTTSDSGSVPGSLGAAIAALFSGGDQTQSALDASTSDGPGGSACDEFTNGGQGPDGITTSPSVTPGSYGPSSASVQVGENDDCQDATDAALAFASFNIDEDITATCENGATVTLLAGSSGVYRNDATQGHFPEIYGTFNIRDDDGVVYQNIRCMIILDEQETVLEAACEDSDGQSVDLSASDVCQFNTQQQTDGAETTSSTTTSSSGS